MRELLDRFRPRREPIAYLVALVAVVLAAFQVLAEGKSLADVFAEGYVEGLVLLLSGAIARASVYAPANVEVTAKDLDKAAREHGPDSIEDL